MAAIIASVEPHVSVKNLAPHVIGYWLRSPYSVGMENPVILFDSDCGFCRWSLSKILAWDRAGRLRPVALQSSEADDLLSEFDPERKMVSWHLIVGGRIYSGGEAVPHLARLLPAGTPIALLASTFPRTTDGAYRWVARHRDRLGKVLGEKACAVDPTRRASASGR
jgi:predicted DCC family thiol-disulfide oxidoreductase YuxK